MWNCSPRPVGRVETREGGAGGNRQGSRAGRLAPRDQGGRARSRRPPRHLPTTCSSPAGWRSAVTSSTSRGRSREASTRGAGTRARLSASPPRWDRTTSARRSTATWACTSSAGSSRGGSSRTTWAGSTARRRARTGTTTSRTTALGLISMVSHLPAMLPVAVGAALAFRIREERRVALGWFGEGASARGDAHEAMNFAGVRRLPVVFVCDNNQWAYSTPARLEYACEHVADRAEAYGFEGVVVDGTDVLGGLSRGAASDREGARGRRADAARVPDPADGGPRGSRRRLLRPEGDLRGVGAKGSDRALPGLASRAAPSSRRTRTTRSAPR